MKMQARAEPRGRAARLVVVAASPRTRSSDADAAPNRKCLRVTEACPPQVFQFWFILMASVIESEIQLVEQRPLQIAEPLIARAGATLHHQAQLPLGCIARQRGQESLLNGILVAGEIGVDF